MGGDFVRNKTDKGFELIYWKLSYRRRLIRNLWWLPIVIISIAFMFLINDKLILNRIVPIVLLILYIVELIYNYMKWNKCEKR